MSLNGVNVNEDLLIKKCPNCGGERCLYGYLEPRNIDDDFDGKFYIPGIERHSFWSTSDPFVDLNKQEKFHACPDCGHLWSRVIKRDFIALLERTNWDGEEQFDQPERPNFFWSLVFVILFIFLIPIVFFYTDYWFF